MYAVERVPMGKFQAEQNGMQEHNPLSDEIPVFAIFEANAEQELQNAADMERLMRELEEVDQLCSRITRDILFMNCDGRLNHLFLSAFIHHYFVITLVLSVYYVTTLEKNIFNMFYFLSTRHDVEYMDMAINKDC